MLEYLEKAVDLVKNLIPPADGAAEAHVRRWRVWIACATFINSFAISLHVALACGFASPFYPGFAVATESSEIRIQMAQVKMELQNKRIKELTGLLLDTKQKHCLAMGEAKRLYLWQYNTLRGEYYDAMKREFPDPPCSDFQ